MQRDPMLKYIVYTVICLGSGWIALTHNPIIPSAQKDLVAFIVTVSAIIFGVIGAWLALVKVEIEANIDNASKTKDVLRTVSRARSLIEPLTISCLVLLGALLFNYIYFAPFGSSQSIFWSKLGTFFVTASTLGLIYSIVLVLYQGALFLLGISEKGQTKRAEIQRAEHSTNVRDINKP
ncbi:hypothetical protein GTU35_003230 [Vibrio fluvialis]|nr:hypothetical protein [Vibrio fluvialis]